MDGQSFSREIAFSQTVINIGSENGNDIILRGNQVAEFHAMLHFDSGHWYITPLDGEYRTTVNGRSVDAGGAVLQNGSILEIGGYRMTLMLNGINTDIVIQSPVSDVESVDDSSASSGDNILLAITQSGQTELDAGSYTEYELTVTNAGPLVANMQLQVQGIPTGWVQIIPPVLNLNEGRKGTFQVRISPPRDSSSQAGLYNLHFVAISPNYPRATGIADTMLTILPYSEFLVTGPSPRQLKLSYRKRSETADLVVVNNSNSNATFFIHSNDDANELNFAYPKNGGSSLQGQDSITVRAGDNTRVPIEVTTRKVSLIGFNNKHHHFYTNVTPSDRPGDTQTVAGEAIVSPGLSVIWLIALLVLLAVGVLLVFQPYIHQFNCLDGHHNQVVLAGNSAWITWNVSRYATRVTLNDGTTETELDKKGSRYVSPTSSTTYTLRTENFLSKILSLGSFERTVQVLVIPKRPEIEVFRISDSDVLYDQQVTMNWAVDNSASAVNLVMNKSTQSLEPEKYTSSQTQGLQTDTLISLRAQNASGYEMKSGFVNVLSNKIKLNRFTVWVRPNGIAIPSDNDVRRTTRWSALQLVNNTQQTNRAGVSPQPAPQANTLDIPDNFSTGNFGTQGMNPETMAISGQSMPSTGYSYEGPAAPAASWELLVSPSLNATPVPTQVPTAQYQIGMINRPPAAVQSTAVPSTSPEGSSSFNRDFSIKLVEVVEDPLSESGYRLIDYFPDYVLQKGEQILVEWNVDGVSQVKIDNLSGDVLQASGGDFTYPDKSVTYVLNAEAGNNKKVYSLPVRVAGDADNGEGSGLNCELKVNATTLKVPGAVMVTWSGGGTNRVQLLSSTQAEKENDEAEKRKEEEAKAAGQSYTRPTQAPLAGGIIGDYLQPSGFMRVNVDKQTTFMLNAYDGNGNVICTKSVEVKYEGGVDKKNLKLAITRVADADNVVQSVYGLGQMITYTVALTDFEKGKDPTGNVMLTDGVSTCSMTLPVTSCSFAAKKTGELTLTAVYAGDDTYNKATATGKETVIAKLDDSIQINSAIKTAVDKADLDVELIWDQNHSYGLEPSGVVTLTIGSGTCDVNLDEETMTCDGTLTVKKSAGDGSILLNIKGLGLKDTAADRVVAAYKGDNYFKPSTSQSVLFLKIPTSIKIYNPLKDGNRADLETALTYDDNRAHGLTPTGTITYTIIRPDPNHKETTCVLTIPYDKADPKRSLSCTADELMYDKNRYKITEMLFEDPESDRVKAVYSGDFLFNKSESPTVLFGEIIEEDIETHLNIDSAKKDPNGPIDLNLSMTWDETIAAGAKPGGNIKVTSGTGTCTLNLESTKPSFTDCKADSVTLEDHVYVIKNLQITGAGDSIVAAYPGSGRFLASTAAPVYFDRVDTATTIVTAYKTYGNLPTLVTSLSWKTAESLGEYPLGTITFKIGTDNCVLTLDNDEAAGKVKSFSCEGSDTVVGDGVLTTDGDNSVLTWKIERIVLSAGNNADRVKANYNGDEFFNASSSKEVMFDTVETEIAISDQMKTPSGLVSLKLDLSWYKEPPADGMRPTGLITLTSGTKNCTLDISENPAKFTDCEFEKAVLDTSDPKHSKFEITGLRMGSNSGTDIKAVYSGDGTFLDSTSQTKEFNKLDTWIEIDKAYKPDSVSLADILYHLKWKTEESEGKTPSGTIMLTVGTDVCKFDLETKKLTGCTGDGTSISWPVSTDGDYIGDFQKLIISSTTADRVKVEYSGDSIFNPSSLIALFQKVNTTLKFIDAEKVDESYADVTSLLDWKNDENWLALGCDKEGANCPAPTGTVKFTVRDGTGTPVNGDVVSGTCILDLVKKTMDCEPGLADIVPAADNLTVMIQRMLLADKTADRIKAEYSGDSFYNASESTIVLFDGADKKDTELEIMDASKSDNKITLTAKLTPEGDETGTIVFTSGSATCTIDITNHSDVKFEKCSGKAEFDSADPTKINITDMVMNGTPGDSIYAEYSGDSSYNKSTSPLYSFKKYDTKLDIEKAYKSGTSYADLNTLLTWNKTKAGDKVPTGTITLSIGGDSCKLTFDGTPDDGHVKDFTCFEKDTTVITPSSVSPVPTPDMKIITWEMVNILLSSGSTADRVKAEYSGDANFNPSTTEFVLFKSIPTEVKIIRMYPDFDPDEFFVILQLSWTEEPPDSGRIPTGTINLKVGDKVCPLRLTETEPRIHSDICHVDSISGVPSGKIWELSFRGIEMGKISKNSARTEYLGDNLFRASKYEHKVDTQTTIDRAHIMPDGTVDITFTQQWDQILAGILTDQADDRARAFRPSGTFKITVGASSCTLQMNGIADPAFTDCVARAAKLEYTTGGNPVRTIPKFVIEGLKIGDGTAAGIKVEYSGDAMFNTSSDFLLLNTVPTTTLLLNQEKDPSGLVSALVELSWTKDPKAGDDPKGTIKLTSGSAVCTLDLAASPLRFTDCSGSVSQEKDGRKLTYKITNLNMGSGVGDDVKAEFSGSGSFLASASDKKSFKKVDTELEFNSAFKPNDTLYANLISVLSWNKEKAATRKPTGTIKYTVGSGICELNLSTNKLSCDSAFLQKTEGEDHDNSNYRIVIEKMLLADSGADRITAEYSGDSVFNPSSTVTLLFKTVPTEISIRRAILDDEQHATVRARLNWDEELADGRKPSGTVKFVMGSGSCTLTIETGKLSCEPATGMVSSDRHTFTGTYMLLDDTSVDRASAEYSGDGFFAPSVSTKVLFGLTETEMKITNAVRVCEDEECYVNLNATLNWEQNDSVEGLPTGTVTIKYGDGTISFALADIMGKKSEHDQGIGVGQADAGLRTFTFNDLVFKGDSMPSVKDITIEYSGDKAFRKTTSEPKEFDKIPTIIKTIDRIVADYTNASLSLLQADFLVEPLIPTPKNKRPYNVVPAGHFEVVTYMAETPVTCEDVTRASFRPCDNSDFYAHFDTTVDGKHHVYVRHTGNFRFINIQIKFKGDTYFKESEIFYDIRYSHIDRFEIRNATMDSSGAKYFVLDSEYRSFGVTEGTLFFSVPSGKNCSLKFSDQTITENNCVVSEIRKIGIKGIMEWMFYKLELGDDTDKSISVRLEHAKYDNEYLNDTVASTTITPVNTTLSGDSVHIYQDSALSVPVKLSYDYGISFRDGGTRNFGIHPYGNLVIKRGNYTCTVKLDEGGSKGTLLNDCGGGRVSISRLSESYSSWQVVSITVEDLPYSEENGETVTVEFAGDNAYQKSNSIEMKPSRQTPEFELSVPSDSITPITTSISNSASNTYVTGKITYNFINSGRTCTVDLTYSGGNYEAATTCPAVISNLNSTEGSVSFDLDLTEVDASDYLVNASYSGDGQNKSATTQTQMRKHSVTLRVVSPYSDGRPYFNTKTGNVSYPLYPERHIGSGSAAQSFCSTNPDSAECHVLLHSFPLTIEVQLENPNAEMPEDWDLTFEGVNASCVEKNKVRDGLYNCKTGNISFGTVGEHPITVKFAGSDRLENAETTFATMWVSLTNSLPMTNTIAKTSGSWEVGQTVTVTAETVQTSNGSSISYSGDYLFYTYNQSANERIKSCYSTSCDLEITADTDYIIAEFLGTDQYMPSSGYTIVNSTGSPVSFGTPVIGGN